MTNAPADDLARTTIAIPGTTNLRDLGGLPGPAGMRIAPGRLFRSELLVDAEESGPFAAWRPEHSSAFDVLGLHTVIDLRSAFELARHTTHWDHATGARVVSVAIEEGGPGTVSNVMQNLIDEGRTTFDADDLADFYIGILDRRAVEFARAVRELAQPGSLPGLIHCAIGKDRTGILVAIILDAIGVPRPLVIADYQISEVLVPAQVELHSPMLVEAGLDPTRVLGMFQAPARTMELTLGHLDERYGGGSRYLVEAGDLAVEDVNRLADALLIADEN